MILLLNTSPGDVGWLMLPVLTGLLNCALHHLRDTWQRTETLLVVAAGQGVILQCSGQPLNKEFSRLEHQ